jgi:hypothetical protein
MVDLHNAARASVVPAAATPIPKVSWDQETADFAIAYASKCIGGGLMSHNPTRYLPNGDYLGENIWATTRKLSFTDTSMTDSVRSSVGTWAGESQYYNYATNGCASGQLCGHYTQGKSS